jgi:hypothetical protein
MGRVLKLETCIRPLREGQVKVEKSPLAHIKSAPNSYPLAIADLGEIGLTGIDIQTSSPGNSGTAWH